MIILFLKYFFNLYLIHLKIIIIIDYYYYLYFIYLAIKKALALFKNAEENEKAFFS